MTVWFIETVNSQDNWVRHDDQNFFSFMEAWDYVIENGLDEDKYYYRVNYGTVETVETNDYEAFLDSLY
jgi:hypothetical protein